MPIKTVPWGFISSGLAADTAGMTNAETRIVMDYQTTHLRYEIARREHAEMKAILDEKTKTYSRLAREDELARTRVEREVLGRPLTHGELAGETPIRKK